MPGVQLPVAADIKHGSRRSKRLRPILARNWGIRSSMISCRVVRVRRCPPKPIVRIDVVLKDEYANPLLPLRISGIMVIGGRIIMPSIRRHHSNKYWPRMYVNRFVASLLVDAITRALREYAPDIAMTLDKREKLIVNLMMKTELRKEATE